MDAAKIRNLFLVILLVAGFGFVYRLANPDNISSFEDCREAGHTVYDADFRTCVMPDGTTFTESSGAGREE